jgi:hypothetical protein
MSSGEEQALGGEVCRCTLCKNPPMSEQDNLVGELMYELELVRCEHHRAAERTPCDAKERHVDQMVRHVHVHRTQRVVQQQQRRLAIQRACQRDSRLLAPRDGDTSLSDLGPVACGEAGEVDPEADTPEHLGIPSFVKRTPK